MSENKLQLVSDSSKWRDVAKSCENYIIIQLSPKCYRIKRSITLKRWSLQNFLKPAEVRLISRPILACRPKNTQKSHGTVLLTILLAVFRVSEDIKEMVEQIQAIQQDISELAGRPISIAAHAQNSL